MKRVEGEGIEMQGLDHLAMPFEWMAGGVPRARVLPTAPSTSYMNTAWMLQTDLPKTLRKLGRRP